MSSKLFALNQTIDFYISLDASWRDTSKYENRKKFHLLLSEIDTKKTSKINGFLGYFQKMPSKFLFVNSWADLYNFPVKK